MSPKKPIGVNSVAKMLKDATTKIDIDVSGYGLRCLFVTTLVNDPSVSTEEALCAFRHLSVAAQRHYMTLVEISEAT